MSPLARSASAAALVVAALGWGCASPESSGWTAESPYREDIQTVAVPIVANDSFIRGIEFQLTDALIKEIEARTPYTVTSQTWADTVLLAHIREVNLDRLSKSTLTGLGEEVLVGVTIDFKWVNLVDDVPILDRKSFTGQSLFVPSAPTSERVELGRTAVVQQLARDVVGEMQASW